MIEVRLDGTRLEVRGSLDAEGAVRFLDAVKHAHSDLHVDGSGLQELDGAGLTALMVARRACHDRGHSFTVLTLAPNAVRHLRCRRALLRMFASAGVTATDLEPSVD
jgi:ABC-type transporter Mla MlaB component